MTRVTSICLILAVTLAGCSSAPNVVPSPIPEHMTAACADDPILLTPGFKPAAAVDFVGFRTELTEPRAIAVTAENPSPSGNEAAWTATFSADIHGTPCKSASDTAACKKAFDNFRALGDTCQGLAIVPKVAAQDPAPPLPGRCGKSYLFYSRGDELGVVDTIEKARVFLGDIDSPEEAFFLLQLGGTRLACTGSAPLAFRVAGDGYDVQTTGNDACGNTLSVITHISKAGQVTQVSQTAITGVCR